MVGRKEIIKLLECVLKHEEYFIFPFVNFETFTNITTDFARNTRSGTKVMRSKFIIYLCQLICNKLGARLAIVVVYVAKWLLFAAARNDRLLDTPYATSIS